MRVASSFCDRLSNHELLSRCVAIITRLAYLPVGAVDVLIALAVEYEAKRDGGLGCRRGEGIDWDTVSDRN
jgi:hypothetical protein